MITYEKMFRNHENFDVLRISCVIPRKSRSFTATIPQMTDFGPKKCTVSGLERQSAQYWEEGGVAWGKVDGDMVATRAGRISAGKWEGGQS